MARTAGSSTLATPKEVTRCRAFEIFPPLISPTTSILSLAIFSSSFSFIGFFFSFLLLLSFSMSTSHISTSFPQFLSCPRELNLLATKPLPGLFPLLGFLRSACGKKHHHIRASVVSSSVFAKWSLLRTSAAAQTHTDLCCSGTSSIRRNSVSMAPQPPTLPISAHPSISGPLPASGSGGGITGRIRSLISSPSPSSSPLTTLLPLPSSILSAGRWCTPSPLSSSIPWAGTWSPPSTLTFSSSIPLAGTWRPPSLLTFSSSIPLAGSWRPLSILTFPSSIPWSPSCGPPSTLSCCTFCPLPRPLPPALPLGAAGLLPLPALPLGAV